MQPSQSFVSQGFGSYGQSFQHPNYYSNTALGVQDLGMGQGSGFRESFTQEGAQQSMNRGG